MTPSRKEWHAASHRCRSRLPRPAHRVLVTNVIQASAEKKEKSNEVDTGLDFVLIYDENSRIFEAVMLRLSKKTDYALMAMKHLASDPRRRAASAREIAETYDIPVELMAKVLTRLVQSGLLTSHQGVHGGYVLAQPPAATSVAAVLEAIDEIGRAHV